MKRFLLILFLLTACAKPYQKVASNNFYISTVSVVSGVQVPCENCLSLEILGSTIRLSYANHPQEDCSGEGTLEYVLQGSAVLPSQESRQMTWSVNATNQVGSNNVNCYPSSMDIFLDYLNDNPGELQFSFLGKSYILRKNQL